MNGKHTYSKQIIEIADFIFKHPNKKMSDVLSYFVERCRKNRRTVERYVKQAREYNKTRIQKQEKAKDEVLIAEAKESLKKAILTREESLEILSNIAKGVARKLQDEVLIPSDGDRTRAIQQLAKMQGWDEAQRIENTITINNPLEEIRRIYGIDNKTDSGNETTN